MKSTVYLTLEPTYWKYAREPSDPTGFVVAKMTKSKPKKPTGLIVKLTLDVPKGAFLPLEPEVEVIVPVTAVDHAVSVTVEDPDNE